VFQRARKEVDAALRAERLKMRRSNTLRPAQKANNSKLPSRPILERSQSTIDKRQADDK